MDDLAQGGEIKRIEQQNSAIVPANRDCGAAVHWRDACQTTQLI